MKQWQFNSTSIDLKVSALGKRNRATFKPKAPRIIEATDAELQKLQKPKIFVEAQALSVPIRETQIENESKHVNANADEDHAQSEEVEVLTPQFVQENSATDNERSSSASSIAEVVKARRNRQKVLPS